MFAKLCNKVNKKIILKQIYMTSNNIFFIIIAFIIIEFIFNKVLDFLNNRNRKEDVPKEMLDYYDKEKYLKSAKYHKEKGKVSFIQSIISTGLIIGILIFGLFGILDTYLSAFIESPFVKALAFFGIITIINDIISIPFSIYDVFVIEEKYGFNKTTVKTFILDKLKGYLLIIILGGGFLYLSIFIIETFESGYWFYLWLVITVFMLLLNMFYADIILPLFNKLSPLENSELRTEIEKYAKKVGYNLKNIFIIDGSKRSTKANAFFSGIGPKKTIALYDTLIEKQTSQEITAVLAHEIGHFKKKHILSSMIISIIQTGITVYLLELFLTYPQVSEALGAAEPSFHIGIIAFSLVFSPIALIIGVIMNVISRKNEFEADEFAKQTYNGKALATSLKKLSVDSLANLYPHKAYVFVHYSHPPILERLRRLK
jgi:STE24 endopeptidase